MQVALLHSTSEIMIVQIVIIAVLIHSPRPMTAVISCVAITSAANGYSWNDSCDASHVNNNNSNNKNDDFGRVTAYEVELHLQTIHFMYNNYVKM